MERSIQRRAYFRNRRRDLYNSNEQLGFSGEEEAKGILNLGEKLMKNEGCDFIWKDKKLDVKTSIFKKGIQGWRFILTRQKDKIDYFLCICKMEDRKTRYVFLIPDKDLKVNHLEIRISTIQKYMKYILRVR